MSNNFEKDLPIVKNMLIAFKEMIHGENGVKLSERAEMAAGWWFYDIFVTPDFLRKLFQQLVPEGAHDRKATSIKIVDYFQGQLRKYGSEAKIKMHGEIPFAAPWWAWLMRELVAESGEYVCLSGQQVKLDLSDFFCKSV